MSDISALILLPRLKVQNANAISGPLTWGFPSPTAFTGFVHALERKFAAELKKVLPGSVLFVTTSTRRFRSRRGGGLKSSG